MTKDDSEKIAELTKKLNEGPHGARVPSHGYPPGWRRCPGCDRPALDGHITCGDVVCDEGSRR